MLGVFISMPHEAYVVKYHGKVVKLKTLLNFLPDMRELGEQCGGAGDERTHQERPGEDAQELPE